ncbi:Uncharacterised protein [Mycobacteroides abscessus]|nr:Uncharacterised protein [Mycobacteroides abscessus]
MFSLRGGSGEGDPAGGVRRRLVDDLDGGGGEGPSRGTIWLATFYEMTVAMAPQLVEPVAATVALSRAAFMYRNTSDPPGESW